MKLILRNKLKTSTTVERIRITADGKLLLVHETLVDIPFKSTRNVVVPLTAYAIEDLCTVYCICNRRFIHGGQVDLEVIHTYNRELVSFKVHPLHDKDLPYILYLTE